MCKDMIPILILYTYNAILLIIGIIGTYWISDFVDDDQKHKYWPSQAYFAFLIPLSVYIGLLTSIQWGDHRPSIPTYLEKRWFRQHFYVYTCLVQIFQIILCVYAIVYKDQVCFCSQASGFFMFAFFMSNYIFSVNYYALLNIQNKTWKKDLIINISYYLQIVLIIYSKYSKFIEGFQTAFNYSDRIQQALGIFALYHLCYYLFIMSPLFIFVCIFIFLQYIKVIYISVEVLKEGTGAGNSTLLVFLIIFSLLYQLKILHNLYLMARPLLSNIRQLFPTTLRRPVSVPSQPESVPRQPDPVIVIRINLPDHEMQQLEVVSLHSIVIDFIDNKPVYKQLPNCTICDQDVQSKEKLVTLKLCKHTFHQACIIPWINLKNTCPNCRAKVIYTR